MSRGVFSWCTRGDSGDEGAESTTREANGVAENVHVRGSSSGIPVGREKLTWGPTPNGKGAPSKPPKPPSGSGAKNKVAPLGAGVLRGPHVMSSNQSGVQLDGAGAGGHQGDTLSFAAEELSELGFPVYVRETLSSQPTSSSQPIAFLALETELVEANPPNVPSTSGRDGATSYSYVRKHNNKLVPVYTNANCEANFKIGSYKEYAPVLRKLLKRDPLLTFALQKALRYLKAGEIKTVNHVTPDPSGQTSSLFGMRITPCVWSEEDRLQPALLVEHNVPYNPAEIMPRLMRDYAVLSHVPAILTLIDFQGKVLYQNASSLAYMGDLLSAKYDKRLSEGLLKVLFVYDLHNLEDLLEDVLGGQEWQGVVQVPYSLRHYLASADNDDHLDVDGPSGGGNNAHHHGGAGAMGQRITPMQDELEVQFQIGNSFTTRGLVGNHRKQQQTPKAGTGMSGSFLTAAKQGGGTSPLSGPSRLATTPQGRVINSSMRRTALPPGMVVGDEDGESFSSNPDLQSHGVEASVAPRKFMTLLEGRPGNRHSSTGDDDGLGGRRGSSAGMDGQNDGLAQDEVYDEDQECFHEVHAIPLLDPVLDKQVVMLVQTDVTARVELENKLADLTEAQLSMLEQLFPRHIIEYMLARVPTKGGKSMRDLANTHEQVMVLFCDVVGFTTMSKEVEPSQVMHFLNELYQVFDDLVDEYGMYKLDIVGDCYIVVAGLIKEDQDGFVCVEEMDEDQITSNAVRIMQFAKAMLRESQPVLMPHNSEPVLLRIGIHTGPLVSGLVGSKMPKFTLFGDTMNTASRMESTCRLGCVHVSDAFGKLLPHEDWENTGGVEVKGKGLMQTRLWVPNSKRQELLELDGAQSIADLRKNLSGMNSFTSTRSRALTEMASCRSRRNSEDAEGSRGANALMAILHNIRGGTNGGGDDDYEGGGGGGTSTRPKSAFVRMRTNRNSTTNVGTGNGGDRGDWDTGGRSSDVSGAMGGTLARREGGGGAAGSRGTSRVASIERRAGAMQKSMSRRRSNPGVQKRRPTVSDAQHSALGSEHHEFDEDTSYEPLDVSDV